LLRVVPQLQERLRKAQLPHWKSWQPQRSEEAKTALSCSCGIPLLKSFAVRARRSGSRRERRGYCMTRQSKYELQRRGTGAPIPLQQVASVRGSSMSPLIHDGYIVAVDSAQTEIAELNGKL